MSRGGGDTKIRVPPPAPGCRELAWPPSQAWGGVWNGACETLKLYRV